MKNESLKIYPYGFAFADEKLTNIPDRYNYTKVLNRYHFYFSDSIELKLYEEQKSFIIIHGHFAHVGINDEYESNELLKNLLYQYKGNYTQYLETLDFIGGRYVIIIGDEEHVNIYPDAGHTRSVYVAMTKNIVASHVHLINDQLKEEKSNISYALSNALLKTPYKNIQSLIPNHVFNMYEKEYTRFFPREENRYKKLDENERLELFERFWKKQLEYYFSKYDNFVLSLSGGGDSRFSLALLREHLDEVQVFTYANTDGQDDTNATSKMLSLDNTIVKQMLHDIRLNHQFFYFDKKNMQLTKEQNNIVNKNTISRHSAYLIPFFLENYPQNDLMHFRANLLEIGQARYMRHGMRESNIDELKITFNKKYKKFLKPEDDEDTFDRTLEEFLTDMDYGTGVYDYHLLDLYNWEIRLSRWHSEILNTHDVVFDTVTPYNHRAIIDISLSFDYEKRRDEYMYKELINRNYPILNFYGDNSELNLYEQVRNKKYKK